MKRIKKGLGGFKKGSYEEAMYAFACVMECQRKLDIKQGTNYSGLVMKRVKKKVKRVKKK